MDLLMETLQLCRCSLRHRVVKRICSRHLLYGVFIYPVFQWCGKQTRRREQASEWMTVDNRGQQSTASFFTWTLPFCWVDAGRSAGGSMIDWNRWNWLKNLPSESPVLRYSSMFSQYELVLYDADILQDFVPNNMWFYVFYNRSPFPW